MVLGGGLAWDGNQSGRHKWMDWGRVAQLESWMSSPHLCCFRDCHCPPTWARQTRSRAATDPDPLQLVRTPGEGALQAAGGGSGGGAVEAGSWWQPLVRPYIRLCRWYCTVQLRAWLLVLPLVG